MYEDDIRQDMIDKWISIYHNDSVCMVHLLSSEEAKELTQGEKQSLLIYAGEFDPRDSMAMAVLDED